ncbi:hypothetical protein E2I00_004745 [Balaenoptera physalus]|uniref:IMD domain-containing protein n=1 Tax=Balaenoptera physalus TaxID=9770 RepID=A0A643CEU8_BALPH|nr:hypothetical protein E2I00_004745 [Balaenoptera physalus]
MDAHTESLHVARVSLLHSALSRQAQLSAPQLRDSCPGPAAHPDSEQQRPIQGTICLQDESELRKQAQCDSGALARRLQAGGNPKALRPKFDIRPPGLCSGIRNSCLHESLALDGGPAGTFPNISHGSPDPRPEHSEWKPDPVGAQPGSVWQKYMEGMLKIKWDLQKTRQLALGSMTEKGDCKNQVPGSGRKRCQNVMEQFNPGLRNLINLGKNYEKAVNAMILAGKAYYDGVAKIGEIATGSPVSTELAGVPSATGLVPTCSGSSRGLGFIHHFTSLRIFTKTTQWLFALTYLVLSTGHVLIEISSIHKKLNESLDENFRKFHKEIIHELEKKTELDVKYMNVST